MTEKSGKYELDLDTNSRITPLEDPIAEILIHPRTLIIKEFMLAIITSGYAGESVDELYVMAAALTNKLIEQPEQT